MKKCLFILSLSLVLTAGTFAAEQVPVQIEPMNIGTFVEIENDITPLINVDDMKKANEIKEVSKEVQQDKKTAPKFRFNQKAINQQRALNFMQHQSNTILPNF